MRLSLEESLLIAWRDDDHFELTDKVTEHYRHKVNVFSKHRSTNVIEIGTRCGYALVAFASVSEYTKFMCIDAMIDFDADKNLSQWKRNVNKFLLDAQLIVANSRDIKSIETRYGFAHVDGDHSYVGCYHDLTLVKNCDTILADDTDNAEVKKAVIDFCTHNKLTPEFQYDGLRE